MASLRVWRLWWCGSTAWPRATPRHRAVQASLPFPHPPRPRVVLYTRCDVCTRAVENNAELLQELTAAAGGAVDVVATDPAAESGANYAFARVIVGPHGAGLVNMLLLQVCACVNKRAGVCARACYDCVCVRACVRACVRLCVHVRMCVHTCVCAGGMRPLHPRAPPPPPAAAGARRRVPRVARRAAICAHGRAAGSGPRDAVPAGRATRGRDARERVGGGRRARALAARTAATALAQPPPPPRAGAWGGVAFAARWSGGIGGGFVVWTTSFVHTLLSLQLRCFRQYE